ncbi:MAG: glycosyltransferase [Alphaproteobacteria bacterium]|nr:glycosyltransferase [Alphaproteobacteria bacterium]
MAASQQPGAQQPDLSIVVPVYNTALYVEACLDSILSQQGCTFELILVNDGSTDNSLQIINDYAQNHSDQNILILDQANQGLSAVRNLGLRLACGDYVAFLDSDDMMTPDSYRRMLELARAGECDLVICKSFEYNQIAKTNRPFYDEWVWAKVIGPCPEMITNSSKHPDILIFEPNANTKIIRSAFARSIGLVYPEGKYFEDPPAHILACLAAKTVGLVNHRGYCYRVGRVGKITATKNIRRFDVLDSAELALQQALPFSPNDEQGARIMFAIGRIFDWCGTMTPAEDRRRFYTLASQRFSNLPKAWLKVFEREYVASYFRQITLLALYYRHIELSVSYASGKTVLWQMLWPMIRHGRIKTLWRHRVLLRNRQYIPPVAAKADPETPHGLFHTIQSFLAQSTPADSFKKDLNEVCCSVAGKNLFVLPVGTVILDIQSGYELLSFQLACRNGDKPIYIVNTDAERRALLQETAEKHGLKHLRFFSTIDAATDTIRDNQEIIGLLKIDAPILNEERLRQIPNDLEILHAFGSYTHKNLSPLTLFRISTRRFKSFYWRNDDSLNEVDTVAGDKDTRPEVSIVVPAYGVEHYLDRCLSSLIEQTIVRKEIIVVDDGSKDRSGEIADEWQARYPSIIKVIHKPNEGCACARSVGLAASTGQFTGFVDGDDWVDPPMFEKLYEAAALLRTDISQCGFRKVFELDNAQENCIEKYQTNMTAATSCCAGLIKHIPTLLPLQPSIWRRLYRSNFLRDQGVDFPHHIPRFDDLPFQFSSFLSASRVSVIPGIYYNYRLQRIGQDVAVTDERLFVHFDIFSDLKKEIAKNGTFLTEAKLKRVQLNSHEWALSRIEPAYRAEYEKRMGPDLFENNSFMNCADILFVAWRSPRQIFRMTIKVLKKYLIGNYLK